MRIARLTGGLFAFERYAHAFDAAAPGEDGFVIAEAGVRRRYVAQAFVAALVIFVVDERLDLVLPVSAMVHFGAAMDATTLA